MGEDEDEHDEERKREREDLRTETFHSLSSLCSLGLCYLQLGLPFIGTLLTDSRLRKTR